METTMQSQVDSVFIEESTSALAPDPRKRVPLREAIAIPGELLRASTAAVRRRIPVQPRDGDLTKQCAGAPHGQRIVLAGRVLDGAGHPVSNVLLELWQANASGTYRDVTDPMEQPLDPNFIGRGRALSDSQGHYRFVTVKPAAYPGPAGSGIPYRPAHIHVSVTGPDFRLRVITQCYFEGDPLFERDFVVSAMRDPSARPALLAHYDETLTVHWGADRVLGYRWDIVLDGEHATPGEW
jgi:protocatechuate 3,4-dioxygenase beta subunit